ncbi:YaaL family protein [Lentibacillus sp. Marseille-P4043]|uniref:YaaL family protein n=1 Tax=Lentibacillus sp. Marseille-P4043 TaxID=2040293 RepID=UPI000D0BBE80|nr:YaaL family protein [Lentibacillus sp. Marseille-P4043]
MSKKVKRKDIDEQLLDSIFTLEHEWKQIRSLVEKSIEPLESSICKQKLAEAKYLFLLREARHRKVSAIRYN